MSILFINGSPNPDGNTAGLAKILLNGKNYETLNLTDYVIGVYGQKLPNDQFDEVIAKIKAADVLVIGSPLYRCYGPVGQGELSGKLFFIFQGAAPEKWMLEAGEYTMSRFAGLYGLSYEGMIVNSSDAKKLSAKV